MADAAADGFESPEAAAAARREARERAAAELSDEYADNLSPSPEPDGDSRAR